MFLLGATASWVNAWLTPIWMLGVGALVGLTALFIVWLIVALVSRGGAAAFGRTIFEGPLLPIFVASSVLAIFGIVGTFVAADRQEILNSVLRIPFVGTKTVEVTIPAAADDADPELVTIPIKFDKRELRSVEIESNADLIVTPATSAEDQPPVRWQITGGNTFKKERGFDAAWSLAVNNSTQFAAQNVGDNDATAKFTLASVAQHPQANLIAITAFAVLSVFLLYLLIAWLFPKASAIGLATAKSEMSQPLFLILVGIGAFALLIFLFIPYHTFGEDIKVLKDSGLTLIMVFAIFHAVWAASTSVSDEIEGKTAITVLSKPIGRRQFILGKFLGISWTSAVMFILLGVWFLIIVAYKPIYDARESAATDPTWQACHVEVARTVPGLVLAFFETLVFAAISIAISTRLPMLANLVICFAIYAFGHLTPLLVQAGEGQFEAVRFVAKLIAVVLPVLDHFNIQAAIAAGVPVPMVYLGTAFLYCAMYCGVALLLALALFEDRDVA